MQIGRADHPLRVLLIADEGRQALWADAIRAVLPGTVCTRSAEPDTPAPDAAVVQWDATSATIPAGTPTVVIAPRDASSTELLRLLGRGVDVLLEGEDLAAHLPLAVFKAVCRGRAPAGPAESQRLSALADTLHQIEAENDRLHALVARLESLAITDPLTGLLNRRGVLERLDELLSAAQRHTTPLSLLAVDLDGLKCVNDALGHAAGDDLLKSAASVLRSASRRSDVAGRLGGDEFAIILPFTSERGAADVAGRIRDLFAQAAAPVGVRLRARLGEQTRAACDPGLSIGIASLQPMGVPPELPDQFLARADDALYRDKAARTLRLSARSPLTL